MLARLQARRASARALSVLGADLAQSLDAHPLLRGVSVAFAAFVLGSFLCLLFEPADLAWLGALAPGTHTAGDSWQPILIALRTMDTSGPADFYVKTYHASQAQFLYSPQAILLLSGLERARGVDFWRFDVLNAWSFLALVLSGLAGGLAAADLARRARSPLAYACAGLAATLLFYPAVKAYSLGQIQTFLNLASILALWAYARGRCATSGLLLGLACLIKPHLGVALVWGLVRRERRFAAAMSATLIVATALSLAAYGVGIHVEYVRLLAYLGHRGEAFYANHGVSGLLYRALRLGNILEWDGTHSRVPVVPAVDVASKAWSALILGVALFAPIRPGAAQRSAAFAALLVSAVVASPVAYEHHFGFLVPIYFFAATWADESRSARRWRCALGVAYVASASFLGFSRRLAGSALNPLESYLLFATLVLLARLHSLAATRQLPARQPDAVAPT